MDREEKLLWFRTASQLFLGLTFVVSGVLKAIDIYGTELKLIEYAGSTGFAFLCEYNMLLSVALCSFEIFLGLWLMTFVYRKISLSVLVATMLFFSGVIIYLMINPDKNITDCGCFGEILPMGMATSLVKNIVILLLGCYLLWSIRKGDMFFHKDLTLVVLACLTASLLLPLYTADNLSLYNPTGYGTGVNMADKKDFTLLNDDFEEVTDSLLLKTEKVYVFVLKEQPGALEKYNMKEILQKCKKENASCFALTSEEYELPDGVTQYFTDAVTLKSLVRSKENGILTLKNGVITNVMKLNDY